MIVLQIDEDRWEYSLDMAKKMTKTLKAHLAATRASDKKWKVTSGLLADELSARDKARGDMEAEYEQYVQSLGRIEEVITPFVKDTDITAWREGDVSECEGSRTVALAVAAAYGVRVEFGNVQRAVAQMMGVPDSMVQGVYGFYCPDPEGIMIDDQLGPEASVFVLWHEIGHLMLGHHLEGAMPETDIGDLANPMHGVRSFEYMADAFAMTMMQRTGVKENRFARMSSFKTMLRFEKHYEEAMNVDFDDSQDYENLSDLMANLDVKAATGRKQEFLRANWPLLINQANKVRSAIEDLTPPERKAYPASIPLGQQSTKEMREEIERQRFKKDNKATLAAAMSDQPVTAQMRTQIEAERTLGAAKAAKKAQKRAMEGLGGTPWPTGSGPHSPGTSSIGAQQGAGKNKQQPPAVATGEQDSARGAVPFSREERIKLIEEAAKVLGGKLQGGFGRVHETTEDAQEIQDLMGELGF